MIKLFANKKTIKYGFSSKVKLTEAKIEKLVFNDEESFESFTISSDYLVFESYQDAAFYLRKLIKKDVGLLIDQAFIVATTNEKEILTRTFPNESH